MNEYSFSNYSWNAKGEMYKEGLSEQDQVSIDDDLIMYINDSLKWIQSWNPSSNENSIGLNYYGLTIIEREQDLLAFRNIIRAWTDLFIVAPENIVLTGSYYTIVSEDEPGQYEKLEFNKFELVNKLNRLINMIEKAINEKRCILHLGI